jgi:hypothetical protein
MQNMFSFLYSIFLCNLHEMHKIIDEYVVMHVSI